jgi:hypothetical protein
VVWPQNHLDGFLWFGLKTSAIASGGLTTKPAVTVFSSLAEKPAASYCLQILWIVHTMRDFGVSFERVPLMCDNTSAISVAKNPVFHKKTGPVERRHHFLRDHAEKGDIEMRYIDTERQLANIFMKPLDSS